MQGTPRMFLLWVFMCFGLLAACRPVPEQLVELPTQAVIATITPIPRTATPTLTPSPIPTVTDPPSPTPTETPLPTRTREPTPTAGVTPIAAVCTALVENAIETAIFGCTDTEAGEICHGAPTLDVTAKETSERQRILGFPGAKADPEEVLRIRPARFSVSDNIWGLALIRLANDRNGLIPDARYISIVLFGGTTFENRITDLEIQQAEREGLPLNRQPPLIPEMTGFALTTPPEDEQCGFVPNGVLIQTPNAEELVINGVTALIEGTAYIFAEPEGRMDVIALEGTVQLTVGEQTREVITGSQSSIILTEALMPATGPGELSQYNPAIVRGLVNEANGIFGLLQREIALPAAPRAADLELLNTLSGEWTVDTQFTRLDGILSEGETPTANDVQLALDFCQWTAGEYLNRSLPITFDVTMAADEESLFLEAAYPGVLFPNQFVLLETLEAAPNTYTATAEREGYTFEHVITFNSPSSMSWRVEAFNLPGTTCTGGVIAGEGVRAPDDSIEIQASTIELWEVALEAGNFYIPEALILLDCPTELIAERELPETILINVSQEDDLLSVQSSTPGIAFPQQLAQDAVEPNLYTGNIIADGQQFFHELTFDGEDTFTLRTMIRELAGGCRVASLQGQGERFEGS